MHPTLRTLALCTVTIAALSAESLKQIASIDLPGPPGKRFDYLTIDYEDHYLLSAHLAAGLLYVIDTRTNKLVKAIPGVPGLKKVYTSDAGDNKIGVVDLKTMSVIKTLPTESKPDGSAYAEPFRKVYVSDEHGKAEAVVNVDKDEIVKTLKFDSQTGMPQYDPVAKKIYVNLQDDGIFAVIDPATDAVVGRYPVGRCKHNHGMTLDPEHHRAFLACEGNDLLTIFDLDSHRPIDFIQLPGQPDVVKFDPGLKRVYAACGNGYISIIQEDDSEHFHKLEDVRVQKRVHSLAVDARTHRVYAPEQEEDGKPVSRMIVYEAVSTPAATK